MFEREEYQFDPETDGFYASTLPSFPPTTTRPAIPQRVGFGSFRSRTAAQVVLADAITAWDAADAWLTDGALNASAWLRGKLGVSNASACLMLNFARKTANIAPTVRDAVSEGSLSTDKANQLLHCFTKKRAEYVERDVDMLIGRAAGLTVNQTRLMMVDWAAKIDVEIEFANGDTEPEDATIKNELFVSETIDGMTVLQGQFDAEVGETIRTAIDLARRLANGTLDEIDKPTDHEGIETDSNDHVPAEDKIGRIITRGVSETFDVGRLTRAIPAPTAKAVRKRDKCCRFPRCDLSYRYTEVHHYVHWVHGGETNVSNLFLLCWRHHRMIHKRGLEAWTITGNPNTILTFKAPSGDTYKTGPPGLLIPA